MSSLSFSEAIEEVQKPQVSLGDLMKYLDKNAPGIARLVEKDFAGKSMSPGDVHQPTALGNEKPKKKPGIIDALSTIEGQNKAAPGTADGGFSIPFDVMKAQPEQKMIFGWASTTTKSGQPIIDKQGSIIDTADLEKAAYDFVLYSRTQGDMHEKRGVGRMIESCVFTKEKQDLFGMDLGFEGWWIGFKVDDESLWKSIKAGERPEFSIGGTGTQVAI